MPESPAALFWAFSSMALQGFGGVLAVAQNELVERRRWITREEFIGDWAVAQVLPGPNMINVALMLGDRCFGLRGAVAAMAGMLAFPFLIIVALSVAYSSVQSLPAVQGALRGMSGVIVGLVAANAIKLGAPLRQNVMGPLACGLLAATTFVAVALMRIPLVWALLLIGGSAWLWAWRQLGKAGAIREAS